jgi:tellurite resistance protein TehA-like permease
MSHLRDLAPSYFGFVMATGIVAIATRMAGYDRPAQWVGAVALAGYLILAVLNALRLTRHFAAVRDDFRDHLKAPGFFTWVAATGVAGAVVLLLWEARETAAVLWAVAAASWAFFTYAIFAALTLKPEKPRLEHGINGSWLLAVVAAQSVVVLAELLAPGAQAAAQAALHFAALALWLAGGMLYTWIIALIFYRYLFLRLVAEDFTAPYWINMGAMAISALAGSLLCANAADAPLLQSLLPFLRGVTILCWATATWWIPALAILVGWRYGASRYPLRYEPAYWSVVFPLGMYSAATHEMSRVLSVPFLQPVASAFLALAALAWLAAFVGLLRKEVRR